MGMSDDNGITHSLVEFVGEHAARNTIMVHHRMKEHGQTFAEATDYLELRQNYHFTVRLDPDANRH